MRLFIQSILIIFCATSMSAQSTALLSKCTSSEFEQEIDSYLDYSVPVIYSADESFDADEYLILDAREIEEYNISHLPGAVHIGFDNANFEVLNEISKDQKILIYCSIGYRSEKIGEKILDKGFDQVHNLYGSIFEWVNQGNPIIYVNGAPTKKVHTYNKKWSKWMINEDYDRIY